MKGRGLSVGRNPPEDYNTPKNSYLLARTNKEEESENTQI